MFIIEDVTVTVKCITSIKDMFLYLDLSNAISLLNNCRITLRIRSARFSYQTMFVSFNSNTKDDTSGTRTVHSSGTP